MVTIGVEAPERFGDHFGVQRFSIRLHKPITSATLFGMITQTPAYAASYASDSGTKPLARLQELHVFEVHSWDERNEAYLVGDHNRSSIWTTRIRLCDTLFDPESDGERSGRSFDTLLELLKLAGRLQTRDRDCRLVDV